MKKKDIRETFCEPSNEVCLSEQMQFEHEKKHAVLSLQELLSKQYYALIPAILERISL